MEEKQIEMKRAHRLTMEGRRCAAITGVSDVLSFDVGEVVLQTEDGLLMIKGEELHVSRLTLEKGEVDLDGKIDSLTYVLRRVIPHNGFFQSLEDFFFWTAAGIFCFGVSFRGNSGSIRGFSLAALVFGMWFYHRTVSPWVITCETFVFRTASKKTVFLCRKALKKAWNWVTMRITCKNVGVKRKKQGSE